MPDVALELYDCLNKKRIPGDFVCLSVVLGLKNVVAGVVSSACSNQFTRCLQCFYRVVQLFLILIFYGEFYFGHLHIDLADFESRQYLYVEVLIQVERFDALGGV